jgi:CheY-like chemotaxis protein
MSLIEGDPGQIQQVLMNLCINASDAMPKGGELSIRTRLIQLDETFCLGQEGLTPGTFFELVVEDTGEGMSQHVMERLFEPFFTTKEEGKGTGLGLSMVYGAVKNHGGVVKASSHVGQGSAFTVLLPLQDSQARQPEPVPRNSMAYGTGTILVVDDEEIIRQLLTEMLQEMGFRVLSAPDGVEALQTYRNNWNTIDLVIMDLIMPRLSGREAFLAMKEINPNVRTVLSTGYCRDGMVQETIEQGIVGFIQKPFRAEELSEALASVFSAEQTQNLQAHTPFRPKRS